MGDNGILRLLSEGRAAHFVRRQRGTSPAKATKATKADDPTGNHAKDGGEGGILDKGQGCSVVVVRVEF